MKNILGTTFQCECGKIHTVPTREVIYSEDGIHKIPELLREYAPGKNINMVADKRTYEAAGKVVEHEINSNGWNVYTYLIPDSPHGDPVCDDITKEKIAHAFTKPYDFLMAVGSGVVNDLCKWISKETGIPYMAIATAASMNGYASVNIAPAIKGMKCVISGTVPITIIAFPSVIENAPYELTTAGLGDVIAKPISTTDWKINHLLFGEYYCPLCTQLISDLEPMYMEHPECIKQKDPSTIEALFLALIYSGVAMTIAGTSFPASGGEHLISHALDMTSDLENIPHDYHGRQVGLGTIFACALYKRLHELESPQFNAYCEETDSHYWKTLSSVVEKEHSGKRLKAKRAVTRLKEPGMWDNIRELISTGTIKAAKVKQCLKTAGAAHCIKDIGCTRERFIGAVLHCYQVRERYTVIDLARAAGIIPTDINNIIDEYLI